MGVPPTLNKPGRHGSTVAETLKTQQRDFVATWEGADRAATEGMAVEVFPAMYDYARLAMEALSNVTAQLVAPHVAVAESTGGSLADSLRDMLPRSQARIEMDSHDTTKAEIERLKCKLAEAKALVEPKSKNVSHMHTYEARNSDCLRSLSESLRPVAQSLCKFVRIQEEEGAQVHRQAQELEGRVDLLDEALDEVRSAAKPIPYTRRKVTPKKPGCWRLGRGSLHLPYHR